MESWQDLLVDLVVIVVFVGGVAMFRTPKGARVGTLTTALAFAVALALVVYRNGLGQPPIVALALLVGGLAGWVVSSTVTMTRIPALIALQNGAGGGASLLVALVELGRLDGTTDMLGAGFAMAGILVGGVALSGSLIAAAKLENKMSSRPRHLPGHNLIVLMLLATFIGTGALALTLTGATLLVAVAILGVAALTLGVTLSIRVGGADMPVLISLLNAFSGLAAAFLGVATGNELLIAAGAMVGSSGTILTLVMARAMNRRVSAILTGSQLAAASAPGRLAEAAPSATSDVEGAAPVEALVDDAVAEAATEEAPVPASPSGDDQLRLAKGALAAATSVIIVPGYGMALAQAQHEVASLARKLSEAGKLVRFAVHPVAGRMPGHMHVLLAEADVEYDDLYEMDAINDDFASTAVAIVVGASDVVNPAAITVADTPISGMPILRAHEAGTIIVCNLDDRPGYSGVPNPLYTDPKAILLFGDARETVAQLRGERAQPAS
ncbi:MAG: NAD(P)(+) transhydrogenase (Re/Si-specific) subunit beta [Coriobacteriia bacterium]|nr:NAD(P)(+) transhydrogenase (Re/Si-specific) subunit beta [Coriobacteriia bacterium]